MACFTTLVRPRIPVGEANRSLNDTRKRFSSCIWLLLNLDESRSMLRDSGSVVSGLVPSSVTVQIAWLGVNTPNLVP